MKKKKLMKKKKNAKSTWHVWHSMMNKRMGGRANQLTKLRDGGGHGNTIMYKEHLRTYIFT